MRRRRIQTRSDFGRDASWEAAGVLGRVVGIDTDEGLDVLDGRILKDDVRPGNRLKARRVRLQALGRPVKTLLAAAGVSAGLGALGPAGAVRDVRLVGLPFLYEALFAVANCPNVALDRQTFSRAARSYRLTPEALGAGGPFGPDIAALDASDRIRLDDDRAAFCSTSPLSFAILHGVLVDLGPVVPHPLPVGRPN